MAGHNIFLPNARILSHSPLTMPISSNSILDCLVLNSLKAIWLAPTA